MTIPTASIAAGREVPDGPFPARHVSELLRSWELVVPMADEVAQLFYARLFELDPSLRPLFHTDPVVQRRKLMEALALVVTCAGQPNDLRAMFSELGERHVRYGVRLEHYATAGEALLWTLDQGLGLLPTEEARDAWVAIYEFVSSAMCSRTNEPRAPHPIDGQHLDR